MLTAYSTPVNTVVGEVQNKIDENAHRTRPSLATTDGRNQLSSKEGIYTANWSKTNYLNTINNHSQEKNFKINMIFGNVVDWQVCQFT